MTETYYSTDNELFNYDNLRDAAEYAFDYPSVKVGDIATIFAGEAVRFSASCFIRDIVDEMNELAYESAGEIAEGYPVCTEEQSKELMASVSNAVDAWADKHNIQPTFYSVSNVKTIKVKFTFKPPEFFDVL